MEQFKRALVKNNQRQMVINRRSIQAMAAGQHGLAGWNDLSAEMIAMWREANRGLAEANAILRGVFGQAARQIEPLALDDAMGTDAGTVTEDTPQVVQEQGRRNRRRRRAH